MENDELLALLAEARTAICACAVGDEVPDESNGCSTCNLCARITAALLAKVEGRE